MEKKKSHGITVVISHTKSLPNSLFELRVPVLQGKTLHFHFISAPSQHNTAHQFIGFNIISAKDMNCEYSQEKVHLPLQAG